MCMLSVGALLSHPTPAKADPVRVTSGILGADSSAGDFLRLGSVISGGLSFVTALAPGDVVPRTVCQPCSAGQTTSLSATFAPEDGFGGFTFIRPNEQISFVSVRASLVIQAGEVTIPAAGPTLPDHFFLAAPFSLTGHVRVVEDLTARVLFDDAVTGSGTATLRLANRFLGVGDDADPVPPYTFDRITYELEDRAPIPEPATLLLFGTGAAILARRTTRRAEKGRSDRGA